jgi:hypothetical protein
MLATIHIQLWGGVFPEEVGHSCRDQGKGWIKIKWKFWDNFPLDFVVVKWFITVCLRDVHYGKTVTQGFQKKITLEQWLFILNPLFREGLVRLLNTGSHCA